MNTENWNIKMVIYVSIRDHYPRSHKNTTRISSDYLRFLSDSFMKTTFFRSMQEPQSGSSHACVNVLLILSSVLTCCDCVVLWYYNHLHTFINTCPNTDHESSNKKINKIFMVVILVSTIHSRRDAKIWQKMGLKIRFVIMNNRWSES